MKRILCLFLFWVTLFFLVSCESQKTALDAILELKYIGKISGNIYYSGAIEGDEYYIDGDMRAMLFFEDTPPRHFALILSQSVDFPYEVMLIIPERDEDIIALSDLARRRLVLLTGDGEAEPIVTAEFIAYSTKELNIDLRRALEKIIT
ncbi:MAG: hypothetical protein IJW66_02610 [Clostridia bacterium]|nr:hypothetical protein [Clostridia bacterium]